MSAVRTPYTYVLSCPNNTRYYGVRFAINCHPTEFWNAYFTSSKQVKTLIKQYGKGAFSFEIRKTFDSVDAARSWENKVLRRLNVVKRTDGIWLNKTDNKAIKPLSGLLNPMKPGMKNSGSFKKNDDRISGKNNPQVKNPPVGSKNGMFGSCRTGKANPNYGNSGAKSPLFKKIFPKIQCLFCKTEGGINVMSRFHLTNCKFREIGAEHVISN